MAHINCTHMGMRRKELLVRGYVVAWVMMCWELAMFGEAAMDHAHHECIHTRYPNLCDQTLREMDLGNQTSLHVISALVNKTMLETNLPTSFFAEFEDHQHPQSLTGYCEELMRMSVKRLEQSAKALESPRRNKHDIQTWLSASLTFLETCKDYKDASNSISHTNTNNYDEKLNVIGRTRMSKKMDYLSQLGSNSLALVNRITRIPKSTSTTKRRRRLFGVNDENNGISFPEWVGAKERKLLVVGKGIIEANAVVAKDGSGNYATVSEAMEAASGRSRFVIYVKAGVYREKIRSNKDGIMLIGDGKYSTVIVGDDSVAKGSTLPGCATFTMNGDGFIARDIGFHNNAGPEGEQAVALSIASDRAALYRCSIVGYQDSLYALALRQFYRECDIHGTIDFIFGNAVAVFQSCNLVLRRPHGKGYNVILANGRSDPGQNTGFSLHKCVITTSPDFSPVKHSFTSFLGRPWKYYSRCVIMNSIIDDAISGRGWIEWPGYGSSVLKTLYFAEYENGGGGGGTGMRVKWPGFHVIGPDEALQFTVATFIAGTSWIPSTGVAFTAGLT